MGKRRGTQIVQLQALRWTVAIEQACQATCLQNQHARQLDVPVLTLFMAGLLRAASWRG